jgi:hypothetical protein
MCDNFETKFYGRYFGERKMTVFDTKTNIVKSYITPIEIYIEKVNFNQHLVKQTNLSTGSIIYLLAFVTDKTATSASVGGIDIFSNPEHDNNECTHQWSNPINCDGQIVNATTKFRRDHNDSPVC